jgi:hypothetical protein
VWFDVMALLVAPMISVPFARLSEKNRYSSTANEGAQ